MNKKFLNEIESLFLGNTDQVKIEKDKATPSAALMYLVIFDKFEDEKNINLEPITGYVDIPPGFDIAIKYEENSTTIVVEERVFQITNWIRTDNSFEYVLTAAEDIQNFKDLYLKVVAKKQAAIEKQVKEFAEKLTKKKITFKNPLEVIQEKWTERKKKSKKSGFTNEPKLMDMDFSSLNEIMEEEGEESDG